jgi:hypothetical protein
VTVSDMISTYPAANDGVLRRPGHGSSDFGFDKSSRILCSS